MTLPTGDDPNRSAPPAFDFLLGPEPIQGSGLAPTGQPGATMRPRGKQRRVAVDSRSLAVPLSITALALLLVGGAAYTGLTLVQSSEAAVKSDSAAFCAALSSDPGVLSQPGFGWPSGGADLATTLQQMKDFQAKWEAIDASAPPTIRSDVHAVAAAAAALVAGVESTKTIDRPTALAQMNNVTSHTQIPGWHDKYCG
jgi:hypothetical protein